MYPPILYMPVIPPPSYPQVPMAFEEGPVVDPNVDYAALIAQNAVTATNVKAGGLSIKVSSGAPTKILSVTGGMLHYLSKDGTIPLPTGRVFQAPDELIDEGAGYLVLQIWPADLWNIQTLPDLVSIPHYVLYLNIPPNTIPDPSVLLTDWTTTQLSAQLGSPITSPEEALERFLNSDLPFFVRGGQVIAEVAEGHSVVLLLIDAYGNNVHPREFLKAISTRPPWIGHPLPETLPSVVISPAPPVLTTYPGFFSAPNGYESPNTTLEFHSNSSGFDVPYNINATLMVPGDANGDIASTPSALPVVIIVHGNHGDHDRINRPSHKGYKYLQESLAMAGIASLSLDCYVVNESWATRINGIRLISFEEDINFRASMIKDLVDEIASGMLGYPSLAGRLDLTRLGLLGHSRGGEAVIKAAKILASNGIPVSAVLSLAPTYEASVKPEDTAFAVVLPSSDGDVIDYSGDIFYHDAVTPRFKGKYFVIGANHNFFNFSWALDEDDSLEWGYKEVQTISIQKHQELLGYYATAFFATHLVSTDTLLDSRLSGAMIAPGFGSNSVRIASKFDTGVLIASDFDSGLGPFTNVSVEKSMFTYVKELSSTVIDDEISIDNKRIRLSGTGELNVLLPSASTTGINCVNSTITLALTLDHTTKQRDIDAKISLEVGLEDINGQRSWVKADNVPRPFQRDFKLGWYVSGPVSWPGTSRNVLTSIRIKANDFLPQSPIDLGAIHKLLLRWSLLPDISSTDKAELLLDDIQIEFRGN